MCFANKLYLLLLICFDISIYLKQHFVRNFGGKIAEIVRYPGAEASDASTFLSCICMSSNFQTVFL